MCGPFAEAELVKAVATADPIKIRSAIRTAKVMELTGQKVCAPGEGGRGVSS